MTNSYEDQEIYRERRWIWLLSFKEKKKKKIKNPQMHKTNKEQKGNRRLKQKKKQNY